MDNDESLYHLVSILIFSGEQEMLYSAPVGCYHREVLFNLSVFDCMAAPAHKYRADALEGATQVMGKT